MRELAAKDIDSIDAIDDAVALTVAQYQSLGAVTLTSGDDVTLSDTGANIAALSVAGIGDLAGKGIDNINASNGALVLSIAQFQALGAVALAATDAVTLADNGANLAGLTATDLGALSAAQIDTINATNNALSLSAEQVVALGSVVIDHGDVATLADTSANIANLSLTEIAALAGAHIDIVNTTDDFLTLSVDQYQALGAVSLAAGDAVTIEDTGANLAALPAADFATLAPHGVDMLDATDDTMFIAVDQYKSLGTVTLAAGDAVTLSDTGSNVAILTALEFADLAGAGIDTIDLNDDTVSLTADRAIALGSVTIAAGDNVTLADSGASITAMSVAQVSALAGSGFDAINSTSNSLTLSVGQYKALGSVALTAGDTVTIADVGGTVQTLTAADISALAAAGIDSINATNNLLYFSVAQKNALGATTLNISDKVTINGTAAADIVTGHSGVNVMYGLAGNDQLSGLAGNDFLRGGLGRDILSGGANNDRFDFNSVLELGTTSTTRDTILDFVRGQDRIDLSTIDAVAGGANNVFGLLAKGTSTSFVATGKVGWYQSNVTGTANDATILRINSDADAAIEMTIKLNGLINLTSTDFIL